MQNVCVSGAISFNISEETIRNSMKVIFLVSANTNILFCPSITDAIAKRKNWPHLEHDYLIKHLYCDLISQNLFTPFSSLWALILFWFPVFFFFELCATKTVIKHISRWHMPVLGVIESPSPVIGYRMSRTLFVKMKYHKGIFLEFLNKFFWDYYFFFVPKRLPKVAIYFIFWLLLCVEYESCTACSQSEDTTNTRKGEK